jgi:AraC family transcriptional regulator
MRAMAIVDKAVWVIERNSGSELSLPAVAAACGVSRSHLASAFASATGRPVVGYLRARRLSMAAERLAAGAPDILALALDSGYRSHEAFTRAFRDHFGITPERVREQRTTDGLALTAPLAFAARARPHLPAPACVDSGAIRAVGLRERHRFDGVVRIPMQWQAFMSEHHAAIAQRLDRIPIGLAFPADDDGQFDYVCAAEVARFTGAPPAGLERVELPARRYAVFEHLAHVSTIFDTYAAIWNDALPERGWTVADAPVVEQHLPTFDPATGEGGLALWIPLADSASVTVRQAANDSAGVLP